MRVFAVLCCAGALWAPSAVAASPTLCAADELVLFACSTGPKLVSICASKGDGKPAKSLQYRFGKADHVELSYPAPAASPADTFTYGTMTYSGGGGTWVRFAKEQYQYTVFSAIGKWGPGGSPKDLAGVAVEQNGKEIANIACHSAVTGNFDAQYLGKLGLKSNPDDDFDIPEAFFQH